MLLTASTLPFKRQSGKMQWPALRPLQVDAINAIFETEDHLILAAATALAKRRRLFSHFCQI